MLKNQWVLITGASAGIGRATAEQMAAQGCHLFLVARRKEKLQSLATSLAQLHGIQCEVAEVDLASKSSTSEFLQKHETELQKIQILINNAGLARSTRPFHEVPLEDLEEMIHTNVLGLIRLTRGLLPELIKKPSAHLINLGSVAGRWTYPGGTVYCATKFAVRALSEGLRHDLLGKNIRVTNIEPGMVETEFSEVRLRSLEDAAKVYQGMTPLSAADIAESIVWCLMRPPHVNVQELVIYPTAQAGVGQVARQ